MSREAILLLGIWATLVIGIGLGNIWVSPLYAWVRSGKRGGVWLRVLGDGGLTFYTVALITATIFEAILALYQLMALSEPPIIAETAITVGLLGALGILVVVAGVASYCGIVSRSPQSATAATLKRAICATIFVAVSGIVISFMIIWAIIEV